LNDSEKTQDDTPLIGIIALKQEIKGDFALMKQMESI